MYPPSLESRMSIIEKLDNWGKHALRSLMAEGKDSEGKVSTWSLAAHSEPELQAWLGAFSRVLVKAASPAASTPGYARIGGHAGSRLAGTPVMMYSQPEEVM